MVVDVSESTWRRKTFRFALVDGEKEAEPGLNIRFRFRLYCSESDVAADGNTCCFRLHPGRDILFTGGGGLPEYMLRSPPPPGPGTPPNPSATKIKENNSLSLSVNKP